MQPDQLHVRVIVDSTDGSMFGIHAFTTDFHRYYDYNVDYYGSDNMAHFHWEFADINTSLHHNFGVTITCVSGPSELCNLRYHIDLSRWCNAP